MYNTKFGDRTVYSFSRKSSLSFAYDYFARYLAARLSNVSFEKALFTIYEAKDDETCPIFRIPYGSSRKNVIYLCSTLISTGEEMYGR